MSSRQINNWFYRLVGARGAISLPNPVRDDSLPEQVGGPRHLMQNPTLQQEYPKANFGTIFHGIPAAQEIAKHRVVFMGEIHSRPAIVSFQRQIQDAMARVHPKDTVATSIATASSPGTLHVVFEHFSFDMQDLLDDYQEGKITFDTLVKKYNQNGSEGHDLGPYRELLEDAIEINKCSNGNESDSNSDSNIYRKVKLHAGFLPRKYARMLMKEGEEAVFENAADWLPPYRSDLLDGTDYHYNIFESLLTGRLIGDWSSTPDEGFRRIFQAQILKDVAMAHKISTLLDASVRGHDDKLLIVLGNGHCLGYAGVPERVLEQYPDLASDTCVLVSHYSSSDIPNCTGISADASLSLEHNLLHELKNTNSDLADYVYIYREHPEPAPSKAEEKLSIQQHSSSPRAVKQETQEAYDRVGESAHIQGNAAKAKAIMSAMKYTSEQIATAGKDIHNFQGVGNPHIHANIQPGDVVLDVGSGLGIDSFIAYEAATRSIKDHSSQGFVLGIDISGKEVKHAQVCAQERQLSNIRFAQADMERIPLPDNSVDVVISNGAFCLAPDKEKAFAEIYRVLKPGGRISICTTTTQDASKLEDGVSWPVCMKMFYPKNDLVPLCEKLGYTNVFVDDSDSSMSMELPIEVLEGDSRNVNDPQRNKVHVGSTEFSHLEEYDMDALCARVCVVARKPLDAKKESVFESL